ncbi:MAG: zinc dependent phospholipase C family protein [Terracidiphilus sp.]
MASPRSASVGMVLCILLLIFPAPSAAYSLLTHEQLIDLTWDDSIVPLLLSRYPNLTQQQLEEARAYAYGGCVIQDLGYYPLGQRSFSNLMHYVRTGDFVVNLFRDAHNANELAFAVGALSHYIGDTYGHSLAVNLAVPDEYHKLRRKYGRVVTFEEDEHRYVAAEFSFDIDEVAHHRMAPLHYLRHIGLRVSMQQLSHAFYQTYGLSERFEGTRRERVNEGGYRFAVRAFIPRIAYAVTLLHRHHEPPDVTTPEAIELHREISEMAAFNHWDAYRRHAGIGTWLLAGFLFTVPKVGPLREVAVRGPTVKTEGEYVHSVAVSVYELRQVLRRFTPPAARRKTILSRRAYPDVPVDPLDPNHPLMNRDLDTGYVVQPGDYRLTDKTYANLLHALASQPKVPIPLGIKEDIETFYSNPEAPITTKRDPQKWAQVVRDLETLMTMPTSSTPQPFPTYDDEAAKSQTGLAAKP